MPNDRAVQSVDRRFGTIFTHPQADFGAKENRAFPGHGRGFQ
jgi:hypothetical protein